MRNSLFFFQPINGRTERLVPGGTGFIPVRKVLIRKQQLRRPESSLLLCAEKMLGMRMSLMSLLHILTREEEDESF